VQTPILENTPTKTKSSVPRTNPVTTRNIASKKPAPSPPALPNTPSKVDIPKSGTHRHKRPDHPRYVIAAYGCSPTVYRGILEEQRAGFALLLRSRDFLGEHARLNAHSIDALRQMKPFWSQGTNCYHWIDCPQLQGEKIEPEGVFLSDKVGDLVEDEEEDFFSMAEHRGTREAGTSILKKFSWSKGMLSRLKR
jgi:hypothetical protein